MKRCALLHKHPYAVRAVFAPRFGDAESAVSPYSFLPSLCKPALLMVLKAPWLIRAVACLFGTRFSSWESTSCPNPSGNLED